MQASLTWSKELTLGANSDTTYGTAGAPPVNDVFNRDIQKLLSSLGRPLQLVISGTYQTPGLRVGVKILSYFVRDWTLGALLRYQSGALVEIPTSTNNLLTELGRGSVSGGTLNNPAVWGGGATLDNAVSGANPFLFNPNCGCFNPQTQLVLNPAAYTDPGAGNFGTSAPYYNSYRWQRQPMENLSIGRVFLMGKDGRYRLQIRAEFMNVFNRIFLNAPSNGFAGIQSPTTSAPSCQAAGYCPRLLTGGFGFVNTVGGSGTQPRSGQVVARFTF